MLVQIAEYLKKDLLRIYTHIRLEDYQVTQKILPYEQCVIFV